MRELLPFYEAPWPSEKKQAAEALWNWHLALGALSAKDLPIVNAGPYLRAEADLVRDGKLVDVVDPSIWHAADEACSTHNLPREWLAQQLDGLALLQESNRFETGQALREYMQLWIASHARLLASLAGVNHSWQLPLVDELAHALFLTSRLASLRQDLEQDRLFIPLEDVDRADVSVEQLEGRPVNEAVRQLLWKQVVRARDAYAHAQPLLKELPRRYRRVFKYWWLSGLEVLNEIERRKYDLWSRPVSLSGLRRFHMRVMAVLARATFRFR